MEVDHDEGTIGKRVEKRIEEATRLETAREQGNDCRLTMRYRRMRLKNEVCVAGTKKESP